MEGIRMRIGIIGSGNVGRTIADGALRSGHEVRLGARQPEKQELRDWLDGAGEGASLSDVGAAAEFGELLVNATPGTASIEALRAAGADNLDGKTLIDIGNAVTQGEAGLVMVYPSDDSLAEHIQREFAGVRVVKALNTMHRELMTTPEKVPGDHTVFICGDDGEAKAEVHRLLAGWSWKPENILDLGDLTGARAMEAFVLMWAKAYAALDRELFNVAVVR
jgi:predicted dinucleotide-binding enzyme